MGRLSLGEEHTHTLWRWQLLLTQSLLSVDNGMHRPPHKVGKSKSRWAKDLGLEPSSALLFLPGILTNCPLWTIPLYDEKAFC